MCVCVCVCVCVYETQREKKWNELDKIYVEKDKRTNDIYLV